MARTEKRLQRAKPSGGTVSGRWLGVLDVNVSQASLDRALRIFDALLKGAEAVGLQIEITGPVEADKDDWGRDSNEYLNRVTRFRCAEEWITVALWEEVQRSEDPKPEPVPRRSAWGTTYTPWQPTTYTHAPTGNLALQMTNVAGLGVRGVWKDGKRQRLEDCLAPFIAHFGIAAQAFKADRAEQERKRLEREAEHQRWEEEQERRRAGADGERLTSESRRLAPGLSACGSRQSGPEGPRPCRGRPKGVGDGAPISNHSGYRRAGLIPLTSGESFLFSPARFRRRADASA